MSLSLHGSSATDQELNSTHKSHRPLQGHCKHSITSESYRQVTEVLPPSKGITAGEEFRSQAAVPKCVEAWRHGDLSFTCTEGMLGGTCVCFLASLSSTLSLELCTLFSSDFHGVPSEPGS